MGNATSSETAPIKVASLMTKKDLKKLEASTGLEVDKISEWQKQFYKDFPSGEINKHDFQHYYCDAFPGLNPLAFSQRTFHLYDTNNDGIIDFKEFIQGVAHMESPSIESQLALSFRFYDIEGMGTIGPEGMEEIFLALKRAMSRGTKISEEKSKKKAKRMFELLDKDKDGQIEQTEFVDAILHNTELQEIFANLDQTD